MRGAALLALALAASGCMTWGAATRPLADPVPVEAQAGEWCHAPSGVAFPESIGKFQRVKITRYDEEGLDASVGYDLAEPDQVVIATVYVFPAPRVSGLGASGRALADMKDTLARDEWKGAVSQVLKSHPGGKLVADEEVEALNGDRSYRGRRASFEYLESFGGLILPARSRLYSFCWAGEGWIVEYRFTWPAEVPGEGALDGLLQGIRWP